MRVAMEGLQRPQSSGHDEELPSPSPLKRAKKSGADTIGLYLDNKTVVNDHRTRQRDKQLELEKRRIELERQRLEQDRAKTEQFMAVLTMQMDIMKKMVENNSNSNK